MKIKELVELLEKVNPNNKVIIQMFVGYSYFDDLEVYLADNIINVYADEDDEKKIYIECSKSGWSIK